jgi:hypothetical protein
MRRRRAARVRPAGGAPIAGCSAMLYRPSNAPVAPTRTFDDGSNVRCTLGRARPVRRRITSGAPDHPTEDHTQALDDAPGRAPNRVPPVPTSSPPFAGAREYHRRCASTILRVISLHAIARARAPPRTNQERKESTRRRYNVGAEPRRTRRRRLHAVLGGPIRGPHSHCDTPPSRRNTRSAVGLTATQFRSPQTAYGRCGPKCNR